MEELNNTPVQEDFSCKTWNYAEKLNKHTVHHTITVTKTRFTHEEELKEAAQASRTRTDVALKNVNRVNTYYGLSRNIKLVIILALIALFSFAFGIYSLIEESEIAVVAIFIVLALILALVAFLVFKKIRPAFILEIETVIRGQLYDTSYAYGSASVNFSKKKHSLFFYLFLVVVFPVGLFYLIFHSKKNKYKFYMDPQVGNEIIDTIGPLLIDD